MSKQRPSLYPFHLTPGGPRLSHTLLSQCPPELRGDEAAQLLLIGCRTGENLIGLAHGFTGRLTGIDEDAESIFYAKMAIMEKGLGQKVSAQLMAPVATNFRPEQFDIVVMEGVFAAYAPGRVLKEVLRILKKGGWLLLADSCWLQEDVPTFVRDVWEGRDHKLMTVEVMRGLLAERGLDVLDVADRSSVLGPFYEQFRGTVKDIAQSGFEGMKHQKALVKHYKHEIDVYHKNGGKKFMGYVSMVARKP